MHGSCSTHRNGSPGCLSVQGGRILQVFCMDMADFEGPGSESEASVKLEELTEPLNQEPGGRWRGPEQMNVGETHFYNF